MRPTSVLSLAIALPTTVLADHFFRYVGGNTVINEERLRFSSSSSRQYPGVAPAPHSPADHFSRIYINDLSYPGNSNVNKILQGVETYEPAPPVSSFYGLSPEDGVDSAYRLKRSFDVSSEGDDFLSLKWETVETANGKQLLRYLNDEHGEWRWIAVREPASGEWAPWWIKPTAANLGNLTTWDYDVVDIEVVEAGPRNSTAPRGVNE